MFLLKTKNKKRSTAKENKHKTETKKTMQSCVKQRERSEKQHSE